MAAVVSLRARSFGTEVPQDDAGVGGPSKMPHYPKKWAAKIKAAAGEATARMVQVPVLEPEGRSEGYFEVIMCAVIKVNLVARFKTQADRTPESFDSSSGIHGETGVSGLNATQGSHEPCGRLLIRNAEIHEAKFTGDIGPKRSRAGLEFGSK